MGRPVAGRGTICGTRGERILRRGRLASARVAKDDAIMKRLAWAALFLFSAGTAHAVTRYDISNVTCETVQALLRSEGTVILSYRSQGILGLPVYDRYVSGQQNCPAGEVARGAGVPTLDKKYCPVRKCVSSQIFRSQ